MYAATWLDKQMKMRKSSSITGIASMVEWLWLNQSSYDYVACWSSKM